MLNLDQIKQLAAQKQLLAAESDLNRQAIRNEFGRLRSGAGQISNLVPSGRSTLLLFAPLAGFLASSAVKPWKGWLKKLMIGWQLFRVVKRLVSAFSTQAPKPNEETRS